MSDEIPGSKRALAKKTSYLPDIHRMLPQSADAEMGVLGAFLLSPKEVGAICEQLGVTPEWFHIEAHGKVFRALFEIWGTGKPIDFQLICAYLSDRGQLDAVGGAAFISSLFTFLPTAANVGYYLEILDEKRTLRNIIAFCTEAAARCYDEQDQVPQLIDYVQKEAAMLTADATGQSKNFIPLKKVLAGAVERIRARSEQPKGTISGACTSIPDIDRMTDGLGDGELWLIVARPSQGKTALAVQIALHAATRNGYSDVKRFWRPLKTAIFSVEMSESMLGDRILAQLTGCSIKRFADGFMSEKQLNQLFKDLPASLADFTEDREQGYPGGHIWIDDTPALSIQKLTARCRYAVEQLGVKMIVVDYAQLLTSQSKRAAGNRLEEVGEVSRGLKAIARTFGVKMIVCAQLNRDVDDRPGHVPLLSDLRECGQLEQDADGVLAPVRPGTYAKTTAALENLKKRMGKLPCGSDPDDDDAAKYAEIHILKQRNGSTGKAKCWYHGEQCEFAGWTEKLWSNNPAQRQANADENRHKSTGSASQEDDNVL